MREARRRAGRGTVSLQVVALLWLAAFSVRLLFLINRGPQIFTVPVSHEVARVGRSLAYQGEFRDPYNAGKTGPTAHTTPLYPLLLSGVFGVLGDESRAWITIRVMNCAMASGVCALTPVLGQALGLPVRAAILVGAALALHPISARDEVEGDFENVFGTLVFVLFLARMARLPALLRSGRGDWAVAAAGAGAGVVGLSYAALFPAALYGAAILLRRAGALVNWRHALMAGLGLAAAMAPWAARNTMVLGSPVVLRSNLGLELVVSNNDRAQPEMRQNTTSGWFRKLHPNESPEEAELCRELGEAEYMRAKFRQASDWIRGHPAEFARLTAQRAKAYWFPSVPGRGATARAWAVTLLGLAGIVLGWRRHWWVKHVAMMLLLVTAAYHFVQVTLRYRYPAEVLLLLAAGVLAERALEWRRLQRVGQTQGSCGGTSAAASGHPAGANSGAD